MRDGLPIRRVATSRIEVRVRYFAALRERRGVEEESLQIPAGLCIGELWAQLADVHDLRDETVLMALNHRYAKPAEVLAADDEVAFFPPVTGG